MSSTAYGIDLSMTSTGLAQIGTNGIVCTWTEESSGRRGDDVATRALRLADLAHRITALVYSDDAALVVIESPSYGSVGASSWDRAGLWWLVVSKLVACGVPVALCAPNTRAKYATGNGKADKAAVAGAVARLFPDVAISNSDESDALVLAHMAAVHLGWMNGLARHHLSLGAVKFPELISDS